MITERIDELAAALSKAQGEMKAPKKDRTAEVPTKAGGKYSYSYADLASTIETNRAVLAKHGLAVTQLINPAEGKLELQTVLVHSSGQFLRSRIPLSDSGTTQQLGGEITYLRRYALCAILGIAADEDTDGEGIERTPPKQPWRPQDKPMPVRPPASGPTKIGAGIMAAAPPPIPAWSPGEAERFAIAALAKQHHWLPESVGAYIHDVFGVEKISDLKKHEYDALAQTIRTLSHTQASEALSQLGMWDETPPPALGN